MVNKNYYSCKHCNKEYRHRQSLHNHIKLKHISNHSIINIPKIYQYYTPKPPENDINCKYCNKSFSFSSGKYRHQKNCKKQGNEVITKKEHILELKKLKEELTEEFTKIIKEHYQLKPSSIEHHYKLNNSFNNTDIGTQNNITIVQLGKEDVLGTLTQKEKLTILNERYKSVIELVKLMHCSGKYPQFNNTIISNLKSEFALTYDEHEEQFVTMKKNELVSDIVSHRTADVEDILEENKSKISKQTNKKVKELLEILEKDDIILTEEDTEFIKEHNTKIMTTIYDNRKELKKKLNEK